MRVRLGAISRPLAGSSDRWAAAGRAMIGRERRNPGRLFYEFRLEVRIPQKRLLRRMKVFVAGARTCTRRSNFIIAASVVLRSILR